MTKIEYLLSKKNGTLELVRGDEISSRIRKRYPLSAQIALLMDKDEKPEEWNEYQNFRKLIKSEVDAEIEEIERQI